jgi:signal peptidase I
MLEPAPSEPTPPSTDSLPSAPVFAATHGGLADVDPWSEPFAPALAERERGFAWPLGLATVAETLEVIALALLMFMAVRFVAQNFIVDGASMEPSFSNGDLLIVNKLAYRSFDLSWLPWSDNDSWRPFGEPSPGDVVVFRFPQNPNRDFIKRVIAVSGQTVEVSEGVLMIDGDEIDESFISERPRYDFGPEVVPEDKLFVLGDNRNNSFDSHSWGMLDRSELIGRADLRYWPLSRVGRVGRHYEDSASPVELSEVSASP